VVRVIGDFNDWSAPGNKLTPSLNGEGWTMDLALAPGVYRYVFLPNGQTVPVGAEFEKRVNVLVIPPSEYKTLPAKKGDGVISASAVMHTCDAHYVRRLNLRTYALRLRTRKGDVADEIVAVWSEGGEQKNYPMKFLDADPLFDYFEVKVVVDPAQPFNYRFLLDDGAGVRAYDQTGLGKGVLGAKPFTITPNQFKVLPQPETPQEPSSTRSTASESPRSRVLEAR
jgi:hypothetical protein